MNTCSFSGRIAAGYLPGNNSQQALISCPGRLIPHQLHIPHMEDTCSGLCQCCSCVKNHLPLRKQLAYRTVVQYNDHICMCVFVYHCVIFLETKHHQCLSIWLKVLVWGCVCACTGKTNWIFHHAWACARVIECVYISWLRLVWLAGREQMSACVDCQQDWTKPIASSPCPRALKQGTCKTEACQQNIQQHTCVRTHKK